MRVHPTFEEFLAGRQFDPATLTLMKEAWNTSAKSADAFMQDMEGNDYRIAEALHVE